MNIYKAEKKDIIDLCDMWFELQNHHRNLAAYMPEIEEWRSIKEKEILLVLESNNSQMFVARELNTVVGYIRGGVQDISPIYENSKIGKIEELFVKESYRDRGAGKMLVEYMKFWLKSKGASYAFIHVSVDNAGARSFWRDVGFYDDTMRMSMKI